MDENDNLRTVRKLERLEAGVPTILNPRRYLRTIADRLSFLDKRHKALKPPVTRPTLQESKRDALFWLMSQYSLSTGYDVRAVLAEQDKRELCALKRFDEIFNAVKYSRCHSGGSASAK